MEANYQDIFLSGYINRLRGHLVVKNETHWHYYIFQITIYVSSEG